MVNNLRTKLCYASGDIYGGGIDGLTEQERADLLIAAGMDRSGLWGKDRYD